MSSQSPCVPCEAKEIICMSNAAAYMQTIKDVKDNESKNKRAKANEVAELEKNTRNFYLIQIGYAAEIIRKYSAKKADKIMHGDTYTALKLLAKPIKGKTSEDSYALIALGDKMEDVGLDAQKQALDLVNYVERAA